MSTERDELYELLDASCEDMLLCYQETIRCIETDSATAYEELRKLFAIVGLSDTDEAKDKDGNTRKFSKEEKLVIEEKLKEFKELASKDEVYIRFAKKYGPKTAKTLLSSLTAAFTDAPTAYGPDDYVATINYFLTTDSELQSTLLPKYPKVVEVVNYIASKATIKDETAEGSEVVKQLDSETTTIKRKPIEIEKIFAKVNDEVAYSHLHKISSVTQARYLSSASERVKENVRDVGVLDSVAPEFSMCLNAFFLEHPQAINIKAPSKDAATQAASSVNKDIEDGLKLLIDLKKGEKKNLEENDADISERNQVALDLAILQGKKTFSKIVIKEGEKCLQKQEISPIIGFDPSDSSVTTLQRLDAVDRNSRILEERIKKVKAKLECIAKTNLQAYNQAVLELAILEGREKFHKVSGEQRNEVPIPVSLIVGSGPENKSALKKLEMAKELRRVQQKIGEEGKPVTLSNVFLHCNVKKVPAEYLILSLIALKKEELQGLIDQGSTMYVPVYNQLALEIAILEGKTTFNIMVPEKSKGKKEKVMAIIGPGQDPAKMTSTEKINAILEIEKLKNAYANIKVADALEAIDKRIAATEERIAALKDMGAKTDKEDRRCNVFREAHAILNGDPECVKLNSKGEPQVVRVYMQDSTPTVSKRLERFEEYQKENKKLLSDSAMTKLIDFIGIIKHFFVQHNFTKPRLQKSVSSPQLTTPHESTTGLKKRSLSANWAAPNTFLSPARKPIDAQDIDAVKDTEKEAAMLQHSTPTISGG